MPPQGTLYPSPTPDDLSARQGTPSSSTRSQGTQKGAEFREKYRSRAGIEGTISQGVRAFGLRRSRYRGMEKTHFQHLVIATAINVVRTLAWLDGEPLAKTRTSKFAALALVA